MNKKRIIIFISLETYLRNWIAAGAFDEINQTHDILYVIPKYDWDSVEIESFGIKNYVVINQKKWRMFFFRKILLITMIRFSKRSYAFRVKTSNFRNSLSKNLYKLLSKGAIYHSFLFLSKMLLGRWNEISKIYNEFEPDLVIAPSLAADSFTIGMTYSANLHKIKSLILINSWDNLVSKGVMPIQPSFIGLWGQQSIRHALEIQQIPMSKLKILGVPRFESYFKKAESEFSIHDINGIPRDKKILLYPSTVLPFNDIEALTILDNELNTNPDYKDYVILFRSHPEMMSRNNEISVLEAGLKNIYLDVQTADFYLSRFKKKGDTSFGSSINKTSLDYYPSLLKSVSGLVCPATTLSLEGLLNGKPCVMLCYDDGEGYFLSASKVAKFENVQEVLSMSGVYPVYEKDNLLQNFRIMVDSLKDQKRSKEIIEATREVVFRDDQNYSERLSDFVNSIIE